MKEIKKLDNNYFQCEECNMLYKTAATAEECEKWCKKHKSCNLEIIKYAVSMKGGKVI